VNSPLVTNIIRKIIILAAAVLLVSALLTPPVQARGPDGDVNALLFSAESLFKSMKQKNYPEVWRYLSEESRKGAIEQVYKSLRKANLDLDRAQIGDDFKAGGELAQAYWDAYLKIFDPDTVLEQSKWDVGPVKGDRAVVNILYRKSKNPAVLKLYREDGVWRVGLEETFRPRRWLLP
jgi:hypothetical protein